MDAFKAFSPAHVNSDRVVHGACPGCGAIANFVSFSQVPDVTERRTGPDNILFGMRQCPLATCRTVVWFALTGLGEMSIYPPADAMFDIKHVPADIEADAREALRCFSVDAYKATVVMCRRTVQCTCLQQSAPPNKVLADQIDDLHSRGLLSTPLKDWAHQLRYFGNLGAHPDPAFGNPTKDDASEMITFMNTFLSYVYQMPEQIKAAQARSGKP